MNKQQKDHLCERIDKITGEYVRWLDDHPVYLQQPLSPEQIVEGVRHGTIHLKPASECFKKYERSRWGEPRIDWNDFNHCVKLSNEEFNGVLDPLHIERKMKALREAQRLKDEVILTDAAAALQKLRQFELDYTPQED